MNLITKQVNILCECVLYTVMCECNCLEQLVDIAMTGVNDSNERTKKKKRRKTKQIESIRGEFNVNQDK